LLGNWGGAVLFVESGRGEGVGDGCCGAGFGWTGEGDFGDFGFGRGAFGPGDFGRGVVEFVGGAGIGTGDLGDGFVPLVDGWGGINFGCGTGSRGDLGDGLVLFVDGWGGISFGCGTGSSGDFGEPLVEPVPGLPPLGCFGTGDLGSPLEGLVDGGVGDLGEGLGELVEFAGDGGGAPGKDVVAPVWLLNAAAMYLMLSFMKGAFLSP
jgi:hypothetical protein